MQIELREIDKFYGAMQVLHRCNLAIERGEVVTLLGPSGCGKTTLLRIIAGFVAPEHGTVAVGGRDITWLAPNRRQVGLVFQNYALFPHLTVAGNVAYGLRVRRKPRAEIHDRVAAALLLVELDGLADRYPIQLSGGQQQRVALARALVLEPEVLLLDEPFNALDARLRQSMQVELRKLIKKVAITSIFVTHDQQEALTISDRIAVMRSGRIEQIGTPLEIYDRPANVHVADFIGHSNIVVERADDGRIAALPGVAVPSASGEVTLLIRPENLELRAPTASGWRGRISFLRPMGATVEYEIDIGRDRPLKVVAMRQRAAGDPAIGAEVSVALRDPQSCVLFPGAPV
jgi:ABC-type Fe3+/spermidine/putrescine transport system ATPase subunit